MKIRELFQKISYFLRKKEKLMRWRSKKNSIKEEDNFDFKDIFQRIKGMKEYVSLLAFSISGIYFIANGCFKLLRSSEMKLPLEYFSLDLSPIVGIIFVMLFPFVFNIMMFRGKNSGNLEKIAVLLPLGIFMTMIELMILVLISHRYPWIISRCSFYMFPFLLLLINGWGISFFLFKKDGKKTFLLGIGTFVYLLYISLIIIYIMGVFYHGYEIYQEKGQIKVILAKYQDTFVVSNADISKEGTLIVHTRSHDYIPCQNISNVEYRMFSKIKFQE